MDDWLIFLLLRAAKTSPPGMRNRVMWQRRHVLCSFFFYKFALVSNNSTFVLDLFRLPALYYFIQDCLQSCLFDQVHSYEIIVVTATSYRHQVPSIIRDLPYCKAYLRLSPTSQVPLNCSGWYCQGQRRSKSCSDWKPPSPSFLKDG